MDPTPSTGQFSPGNEPKQSECVKIKRFKPLQNGLSMSGGISKVQKKSLLL